MSKLERKAISERLLRVRLGLDQDWLIRDDEGKAYLPTKLPQFITREHTKRNIEELETTLGRLVAAGCRRGVLIFGLQQLSPEAKKALAGRDWKFIPGKGGADDIEQNRERPLGTRENLEAVANTAKKLTKLICDYRRELLMAAEVGQSASLSTILNDLKLTDDDEGFSLLLQLLAWVRVLAASYDAPFERTLLKSKGLLCLTLYVSLFAEEKKLKSASEQGKLKGDSARRRKQQFTKRDFQPKHILANIANLCTGGRWAPSDLFAKLKRFEKDHPALYKEMMTKIAALHDAAAE